MNKFAPLRWPGGTDKFDPNNFGFNWPNNVALFESVLKSATNILVGEPIARWENLLIVFFEQQDHGLTGEDLEILMTMFISEIYEIAKSDLCARVMDADKVAIIIFVSLYKLYDYPGTIKPNYTLKSGGCMEPPES